MWYRTLVNFLLVQILIFNVTAFDNCDSVPFCQNLRQSTPDDSNVYTADLENCELRDGTGYVNLINKAGNKLVLEIRAVSDNTFRAVIQEEQSSRYQLQDVLDGEPEVVPLHYLNLNDMMAVFAEEENSANYVMIMASPLEVHFHRGESQLVVLRGNRLILENTETSIAFAFETTFPQAEYLYGLHEHLENLVLRKTGPGGLDPYRLKNLDAALSGVPTTEAVYGAVPLLYGHSTNVTAGVFLHNAAQQWIDINSEDGKPTAYWMAEGGTLDLFVLQGPSPKDVLRQYTKLTGTAHLPQLWALGYHQSRFTYENTEDVKNVIANMDNNDFPVDAIWLDIDYTDGKRYFTWDPTNYADPVEMQNNISATGRKLVTIIDPHIKVDEEYSVYTGALEKDLYVKNADGTVFQGDCWPGTSSWMDFLNPEARDYYASMYSYENFKGSTETLAGIWNDMNEPSVFGGPENTLPGDALHMNGVKHRDVHNIYGLMHTRSTHDGLMKRDNGAKRPFVLSRSNFAGTQRYAAIWTGDNYASWEMLAISIPECLNSNLLGIVFCGSDIGGFIGNPDEELIQRWYQAAIWYPFFRSHSEKSTNRREPYLFNDDVQNVIRDAMKLRYRFIPVWYTLFYEHTTTGEPLIRPLFYEFPSESNVFTIDDEFLVGENILVHPITEPGATSVHIYFPGNQKWYLLDDFQVYQGPSIEILDVDINSIPVFIRAGAALLTNDLQRKSTSEMVGDEYVVHAYLNEDLYSSGRVYYDDFTSFKYTNDREFTLLDVTIEDDKVTFKVVDGNVPDKLPIEKIMIHDLTDDKGTTVKGMKEYTTTRDGIAFRDLSWNGTDEIVAYL